MEFGVKKHIKLKKHLLFSFKDRDSYLETDNYIVKRRLYLTAICKLAGSFSKENIVIENKNELKSKCMAYSAAMNCFNLLVGTYVMRTW